MALRTIGERILALRHHHRRRIAAHALHGGQQRRNRAVAFLQRAAQMLFLRLQLAEPRFDQAQLGLALLDQLARLDQPAVDALALGGELVHVRLDLLGALLGGLQPAAVALELFAGIVGVDRGLRAGQCRPQHGGHGKGACAPSEPEFPLIKLSVPPAQMALQKTP